MKKIIILGLSLVISSSAYAFGVNMNGDVNFDDSSNKTEITVKAEKKEKTKVEVKNTTKAKINISNAVAVDVTAKGLVKDGNGLTLEAHGETDEKNNDKQEKNAIKIQFNKEDNNEHSRVDGEVKFSSKEIENKLMLGGQVDTSTEVKLKNDDEGGNAYYSVKGKKKAKFLGLFSVNMNVEAKVNAENGEVIEVETPWYSIFLF